ncbi:MAG: cobalamin-binding protein [Nitrospirota bacterium]
MRKSLRFSTIITSSISSVIFISSLLLSNVYAASQKRIVSLAPNMTEILFALNLGESIAGVTNFCDYPEEAKKKPKIGGMTTPSLEAIVSLKPDIVVMTTDGNPKEFEERLRSLRIKTYVFKARRLSELPQGIRDIGSAFGVKERADTLAKKMEDAINKFRNQKSNSSAHPFSKRVRVGNGSSLKKKVLYIIWPEPLIIAGSGTVIDDAITLLGAENIASKAETSYPKYSIEEIIHQSPDVIFIGRGHMNIEIASKRLLGKIATVRAVRNDSVFYVSDSLYRLGPRVIRGIEEMAECLK